MTLEFKDIKNKEGADFIRFSNNYRVATLPHKGGLLTPDEVYNLLEDAKAILVGGECSPAIVTEDQFKFITGYSTTSTRDERWQQVLTQNKSGQSFSTEKTFTIGRMSIGKLMVRNRMHSCDADIVLKASVAELQKGFQAWLEQLTPAVPGLASGKPSEPSVFPK